MIEGEDYYFENGLMVLTAHFLKKRGECCHSGCRHCPYNPGTGLRVISLVPSWTETLIEAGVEVVGRTRFCIHPKDKIKSIPVVGGTKDLKPKLIKSLNPDLVLMDQEENTLEMSKNVSCELFTTHVTSCTSVATELERLSVRLSSEPLKQMAEEWMQMLNVHVTQNQDTWRILNKLEFVKEITDNKQQNSISANANNNYNFESIHKLPWVYVIWRDPWMAVGGDTFIYSMWELFGFAPQLKAGFSCLNAGHPANSVKYPKFDPQQFSENTVFFFSTEPYPFAKNLDEVALLPGKKYLVDGEVFSWFGLRSLKKSQSVFTGADN